MSISLKLISQPIRSAPAESVIGSRRESTECALSPARSVSRCQSRLWGAGDSINQADSAPKKVPFENDL